MPEETENSQDNTDWGDYVAAVELTNALVRSMGERDGRIALGRQYIRFHPFEGPPNPLREETLCYTLADFVGASPRRTGGANIFVEIRNTWSIANLGFDAWVISATHHDGVISLEVGYDAIATRNNPTSTETQALSLTTADYRIVRDKLLDEYPEYHQYINMYPWFRSLVMDAIFAELTYCENACDIDVHQLSRGRIVPLLVARSDNTNVIAPHVPATGKSKITDKPERSLDA